MYLRARKRAGTVLAVDSRLLELELLVNAGRLRCRDPAARRLVLVCQELRPVRQVTETRAWQAAESRTQPDTVRIQGTAERTRAEIATRQTLEERTVELEAALRLATKTRASRATELI